MLVKYGQKVTLTINFQQHVSCQEVDAATSGMKSYITKMRARFIQGGSLTEFDSYVSQANRLGADKYAEIWQKAYDSYKSR